MHFVTGGAFQGKRRWVCNNYLLNNPSDYKWLNFYEQAEMIRPEQLQKEKLIVFEGLEEILKKWIQEEEADIRDHWVTILNSWKAWEGAGSDRKVVFIGCDIGKGIVPLDPNDRQWRDITGWCHQELARLCNKVEIIWNGIAQTIKSEGDE